MLRPEMFCFHHYTFDNTHVFKGHTHNSYELNIIINGNLDTEKLAELIFPDVHETIAKHSWFL